jgi:hypothetical protein
MRWLVYKVPRKDEADLFYIHLHPFWFLEVEGMYSKLEAGREGMVIQLLTPGGEAAGVREQVKEGLLDTFYRDKKLISEILKRLFSHYLGLLDPLWLRFFLGPTMLVSGLLRGYLSGGAADFLIGLYLMIGNNYFVRKIVKEIREYYEEVERGIEWALKRLERVECVEHPGLSRLKEIVERAEDKTEAYIEALHTCDRLGLPELREFYSFSAPITEWRYREPHLGFPIYDEGRKPERFERRRRPMAEARRMRDEQMDLFDFEIKARYLYRLSTYKELHEELERVAERIGAEKITIFETKRGCEVNAYEIGDGDQKRILIKSGCHGREPAGPLAILQMMRSLEKEGRYADEVLSRSRISFMPVDDPEGYSMRAWIGIDMAGEEEHWPPQGGPYYLQSEAELIALRLLNKGDLHPVGLLEYAVRFRDPNVVWGDNVKSPRIAAMQEYLEEYKPTFAVDLHETIGKMADLIFKGAGILSIENFYVPPEIKERLELMMKRPENRLARYLSRRRLMRRILGLEYVKTLLAEIPEFEVGEAMMRHVAEKGYKVYRGEYQKILDKPSPGWPPQLISIDVGRTIDGPLLFKLDIRVCPAWLHHRFGTLSYTTETFQNSIDERVGENLAFVEGGILKVLGIGDGEEG